MEILYLLLPISMGFVLLIGGALWWAIFSGQFEGTDKAAQSVLLDDDKPSNTSDESPEQTEGR
ncbi:cbb3-type cytochrome oxidase assembly protein CcoS [Alcaligenaceae bacterium SJ-26]|nr:cbb3-type cytochrome oxidase assembly protein CcoS [Alcaligenaceae bacterium SJ-26]